MTTSRTAALAVVLLLLLAACGGGDDTAGTADPATGDEAATEAPAEDPDDEAAPAEDGSEVTRADADLVIWADQQRIPAIEELAAGFESEQGITVAVQELQFEQIRDQISVAGPAGEGPDIIVGAHDWIGELVQNGVVAPIDLAGREGEFADVAIEAMSFDGQLYGIPYAVENLALFRNTDLVPEEPATWEDLEATALQLQEDGEVERGLLVPGDAEGSPYHNYPMFRAFGGYVFGGEPGSYDTDDIGIDSEGGLAAAEAFGRWASEDLISASIDGQLMQDIFGNGDAAFAISGPWALRQDGRGFEETGVPFEVSAIPPIEGNETVPFVGVQGFMVSAFAENGLLAQTFVTETIGSEDGQMSMYDVQGRPPAMTSALEQVAAEDPVYQAFGDYGAQGEPIPSVPEMGAVFSAWGDAYTLIYQGNDPTQSFTDAAEQMRNTISGG